MGLFEDLFNKHGHKKQKEIKELLEIIKRMETEAILAQREAILAEKNESKLIESIATKDLQIIELQKKLDDCKEHSVANPVKLGYTFPQ